LLLSGEIEERSDGRGAVPIYNEKFLWRPPIIQRLR